MDLLYVNPVKSLLLTFVITTLLAGIIIIVIVIILTRLAIFGKICFSQKQSGKNASTHGKEYLIFSDGGKLSVTYHLLIQPECGRENTSQKKLRIWTLFTQCPFCTDFLVTKINSLSKMRPLMTDGILDGPI